MTSPARIRKPLTPQQLAHMNNAVAEFACKAVIKYENGVHEHGGNLWEHDPVWLVEQAMAEVVDQWMYLSTLRDKLLEQAAVDVCDYRVKE